MRFYRRALDRLLNRVHVSLPERLHA
jgi:hypothetical protein